MQREQPCHHKAAACGTCRLQQYPEQQQHIQGMQQHVDVVVPRWIQLKELVIQGVRQPRHRMPIAPFEGGECPLDGAPIQRGLDMQIFRDIRRVIVIDKLVMMCWIVKCDGRADQQKTEGPCVLFEPMQASPFQRAGFAA